MRTGDDNAMISQIPLARESVPGGKLDRSHDTIDDDASQCQINARNADTKNCFS